MARFEFPQPGKHPQREARRKGIWIDQHGRTFDATAEKETGQPIGELICTSHRQLPWQPPMRFAKFQDHEIRFTWDYQAMIDELSSGTGTYYAEVRSFAAQHKPDLLPDVGGPVDRLLREIYGHPPLSPAVPMAAEAGDPWILGVPGAVKNEVLAALINQGTGAISANETQRLIREKFITPGLNPVIASHTPDASKVTYNEFVAEGRKGGMTMAELAIAWKAHKENTAVVETAEAAA